MGMIQIEVLGTSFAIEAEEDSQYLTKLLNYYKKISDLISNEQNIQDPLKNSIITGLMLCDELYKAKYQLKTISTKEKKVETQEVDPSIENITQKLISKIDDLLK